jgi:glutamine amidotransferase
MNNTIFKLLRYSGLPWLFREVVQRHKVTILMFHDLDAEKAAPAFTYLKKHYHVIGLQDYLKARRLDEVIRDLKQPVFGICVGQQLLCKHSEEGDVDCIGVFDAEVKRFQPQRHEDKVPCMGWNVIEKRDNKLFEGLGEHPYVYFVHSYYVPLCADTAAVADYILPYSAAMHRDNFYACQFHPEKSGKVGEQIIKNFLKL